MKTDFGDRYDRYFTSLEVTRAPLALSVLNNGREAIQNLNRNLTFIDYMNNTLNSIGFLETDQTVAKLLSDFSWLR